MEGFKFCHQIRVRYSEIDGQRVVNNSHYMVYIDVTIIEYLRKVLGCYYEKILQYNQFEILMVRSEVEYKKPARFDDIINVFCRVERLGNSSITFDLALVRENNGDLLVTAKIFYVTVDLEAGKSSSIPPEIRQCIVEFED